MSKGPAAPGEIEIDVDLCLERLTASTRASTPRRVLLLGWDAPARSALATALDQNTELVDAAGELPIHVVLCDARHEPAGVLRSIATLRGAGARLPVIVLVARLDTETATEARRLGATRVLRAPFTARDVRDTLLAS